MIRRDTRHGATMGEYTIESPDEAGRKTVSDGRLWLGKEYSGKEVEYAVKVVGDADDGKEEENNQKEQDKRAGIF